MKKITDIWSIFEQKEIIGSGTFADVYKAKNIKTGDYVAIKEIKKSRISFSETNILKEIEIMKKLESQNSI
jgi:calcium-dependent protein kinase